MRTRRSPRNQECLYKAIGKDLSAAALRERLFIGCFPTGLVYADTQIEEHGDYKKIAYLNYGTLELEEYSRNSPLMPLVRESAARMQARKGESFPIAGNMSVILGKRS